MLSIRTSTIPNPGLPVVDPKYFSINVRTAALRSGRLAAASGNCDGSGQKKD